MFIKLIVISIRVLFSTEFSNFVTFLFQTDYNRHLEELVKETERIHRETLRSFLIKDVECEELLRLWEDYASLETGKTLKLLYTISDQIKKKVVKQNMNERRA